ncbi:MAG: ParB/RepB/Spo0J family partition protein [Oscillospiraceae bacterium]
MIPRKSPESIGSIYSIPIDQLHPHPDNPFGIRDDPSMLELIESVKKHGVLVPAIARPKPEGGYELVAGHRRQRASQLAGLDSMPVIVMNLDDNDTIIQLVDSNIQRENILPSERAKAYKLRMEAVKKKAGRPQKEEDQNSPKISANFRSDDSIGELAGVSGDTIRNYISLTNLIPELMEMVDEKKIALSPAYQIAALPQESQNLLYDTIESEQATPSLSQAQRIRKLSQSGKLNEDSMLQMLILMTVTGMIILLGGLLTYGLGVHEIIPVPRPDLIVVGTSLIGILLIVSGVCDLFVKKTKEMEIEENDERNISLSNAAMASGFKVMNVTIAVSIFALIFTGYMTVVPCFTIIGAYAIGQIVFIVRLWYLHKTM